MSELHVVLGTGAIGRATAEELIRRGKIVRMVNRSGKMEEAPAGAELIAADLCDPAHVREVLHTHTYIPDFGKALVILGERDEADGQAWHVPNDMPKITQGEMVQMFAEEAGAERRYR